VHLVCFPSSCGDAVQDNDIREYKHQLKAERRARKAAESWLRSELKSRVHLYILCLNVVLWQSLACWSHTTYFDVLGVRISIAYHVWGNTAPHVTCCLLTSDSSEWWPHTSVSGALRTCQKYILTTLL